MSGNGVPPIPGPDPVERYKEVVMCEWGFFMPIWFLSSSLFVVSYGIRKIWVCMSACSVTCLGLSSRGGEETATAEAGQPLMHLKPTLGHPCMVS